MNETDDHESLVLAVLFFSHPAVIVIQMSSTPYAGFYVLICKDELLRLTIASNENECRCFVKSLLKSFSISSLVHPIAEKNCRQNIH